MSCSKITADLKEECKRLKIRGYNRMSNNKIISILRERGVDVDEYVLRLQYNDLYGDSTMGWVRMCDAIRRRKDRSEADSCGHKVETTKEGNRICVYCGEMFGESTRSGYIDISYSKFSKT